MNKILKICAVAIALALISPVAYAAKADSRAKSGANTYGVFESRNIADGADGRR